MTAELIDLTPDTGSMKEEVIAGLSADERYISAKYFYDTRGSALFEDICTLPEYYPTRTEMGIMTRFAPSIREAMGPDCVVVEFGSGASDKIRQLLDILDRPRGYMPLDISRRHLQATANALASDYPDLTVKAVCADFTARLDLDPADMVPGRLVGFFPGSTIGNFSPAGARRFLANAAGLLGPGGGLLIGVDLKKDPAILNAAYNDSAGVTAAFNLNVLSHINRELDGTFEPDRFRHYAFYNAGAGRVEMHLISQEPHVVDVAGERFIFREGESIHTENSYKFGLEEFEELAAAAGFRAKRCWSDPERLFSVHYLETPE